MAFFTLFGPSVNFLLMLKNSPSYEPRQEKLTMAGCHFARLPCSLVAPRSRASLLTHPPLQLRHTQVVVVGGGLEEAALVATGQRWECGLTRVWGWHWDLGGLFGSRILSTF